MDGAIAHTTLYLSKEDAGEEKGGKDLAILLLLPPTDRRPRK